MSTATTTLNAIITANNAGFISAMNNSINKLLGLSEKVNTVSEAVSHFTNNFIAEIAAVTAAIGVTSYEAGNFENKVNDVYTLVDETTVSMSDLNNEILKVAGNLKMLPTETAKAHYQVVSAGVNDLSESYKVLEKSGKLAKGGISTIVEAVDLTTTALNAYDESVDNTEKITDQFMATVKEGKTTIGELASSFGRVAPLADKAGLQIEELNAATAALTKNGLSTAEAHTYLKAMLSNLLKPSSEAQKMSEKLGIEFNIQALKVKGLAGFLKDLQEKTNGNNEVMAKLFGSTEALNAVLNLSGEKLIEYSRILERVTNSAGETEKAFRKQSQPLNELWKNARLLTTEIGTKVLPVLNMLVTPVNKLFNFWQGLNPFIKDTIIYIGLLVAVLAPFRYILAVIGLFGSRIIGFIPKIFAGIKWFIPWLIRTIPLLARFLGLTNPIGWAIMAIIGIIQLLRHNVFGLWDAITMVWGEFVLAVQDILSALIPLDEILEYFNKDIFPLIERFLKSIAIVLKDEVIKTAKDLQNTIIWLKAIILTIINAVKSALNTFNMVFNIVMNNVRRNLGLTGEGFSRFSAGARRAIDLLINKMGELDRKFQETTKMFDWIPIVALSKKAIELGAKTRKVFDETTDSINENQDNAIEKQQELNQEIDGTGKRLKKNSVYWQNWAKEINEGLKNKSKRLAELLQKQPNYNMPLSGGVSSARNSRLFNDKTPTIYRFEIDGIGYDVPGKPNLTPFDYNQLKNFVEALHQRQKKRNKSPKVNGGY